MYFIFFSFFAIFSKEKDKFLSLVKPIITSQELSVYKKLKTSEERQKFIVAFWKARDPIKETPENEFYEEYLKRVDYAKKHLRGINSPRGRIYILLGKPIEIKTFRGYEKLVDSELWIYEIKDPKLGLPPFIYLLFFRYRDMGDYILYRPGINTARDLLTPSYSDRIKSNYEAYRLIKMDFPDLAEASLSMIPMEASPIQGYVNSSSNIVISKINNVKNKIADKSYLLDFMALSGKVNVKVTTKLIEGELFVYYSECNGIIFLNYSLVPDRVNFVRKDIHYTASIQITERLETIEGEAIFERTNNINLKVEKRNKDEIIEKRLAINGFLPIVNDKKFKFKLTLFDKTTNEILYKELIINRVKKNELFAIGYKILESFNEIYPFQFDHLKIIVNPFNIFGKNETIYFIVGKKTNNVEIISIDERNRSYKPKIVREEENFLVYSLPLNRVKEGGYEVVFNKIKIPLKIAVLPFKQSEKPVFIEKKSRLNMDYFYFILGEEYLNAGDIKNSLKIFSKIDTLFWDEKNVQYFGKALYLSQRYKELIEMFESRGFNKNYSNIALLANSYLKINALEKAAFYFEELRKYGDSVELNNKLGAIYFSLGDRKKAKIYWNRAKKLSSKGGKK